MSRVPSRCERVLGFLCRDLSAMRVQAAGRTGCLHCCFPCRESLRVRYIIFQLSVNGDESLLKLEWGKRLHSFSSLHAFSPVFVNLTFFFNPAVKDNYFVQMLINLLVLFFFCPLFSYLPNLYQDTSWTHNIMRKMCVFQISEMQVRRKQRRGFYFWEE